MSKLSVDQFESALIDVRKAYRLLYLYQGRILDLMKFIGDNLIFRYSGGWSWFSQNAPRQGSGRLENWAWDWLNMYFYEFNFSNKLIEGSKISFSIFLLSDTGFYDTTNAHKLDLNAFASAEVATTKLIFLVGKNSWHKDYENEFALTFKKESTGFIKNSENRVLIAKPFALSRFINSDETRKCLLEFVSLCQQNGLSEISLLSS